MRGFDAGCGMMVISSLILSGFNRESLAAPSELRDIPAPDPDPLDCALFFLLSIAFRATVLWAVYTASQTVCTCRRSPCKRYTCRTGERASGSYDDRATRDSGASIGTSKGRAAVLDIVFIVDLHEKLTLPQTGQRPASLPLLAASCMELVTKPCEPSKCRSNP